jgi:hypothetical protein
VQDWTGGIACRYLTVLRIASKQSESGYKLFGGNFMSSESFQEKLYLMLSEISDREIQEGLLKMTMIS